MQFTVKERKKIFSPYKVVLKTRSMDFYEGDVLKLQNLQNNNKISGAIVEKIQRGNEKILMDSYLCDDLCVELGDIIDAGIEHRKNAEVVELMPTKYDALLENDFINDIKVHLIGRPIHTSSVIPISMPRLKRMISVVIIKTEPDGIVIVTESTELKFPIMNDENWEAIENFLKYIRDIKK